MKKNLSSWGMGTLVNHAGEVEHPLHAHTMPIFETSTFAFENAAEGASLFKGEGEGYIYTRLGNPNFDVAAQKIASLEALDLLHANPDKDPGDLAAATLFSSGMAAISAAILAKVHQGQTIVAHESLYGTTYTFLKTIAANYGINVVWTKGLSLADWEEAISRAGKADLVYVETPSNPLLGLVDLAGVAQLAHAHGCWMVADNTFASPYCQRPLSLAADVVVHSTTKYLSGHGLIIGGAVVSRHPEFIHNELAQTNILMGAVPSPFDAWLTDVGLRTFEIRMKTICQNAQRLAEYLEANPKVARVYYPGLPSHTDAALAQRQMAAPGGMIAFELKGGFDAGVALLNNVRVATLAVSLGNTDTLISHPASMSHVNVPAEIRRQTGVSDGLIRLSVGIENIEDLLADLDQAIV
jgi:methionine-gamma-lyase